MKALVAILSLAFSSGAIGADDIKFSIVTGVETFKRVHGASNLFPWDSAAPDEIIVSNACGFAQVVYDKVETPDFSIPDEDLKLKPWKALVRMGEWCRIQDFILEGYYLVAYRQWKGKDYVLDFAEIRSAKDDRLYVEDPNFIAHAGLGELLSPAKYSSGSAECASDPAECSNDRFYLDGLAKRTNH